MFTGDLHCIDADFLIVPPLHGPCPPGVRFRLGDDRIFDPLNPDRFHARLFLKIVAVQYNKICNLPFFKCPQLFR